MRSQGNQNSKAVGYLEQGRSFATGAGTYYQLLLLMVLLLSGCGSPAGIVWSYKLVTPATPTARLEPPTINVLPARFALGQAASKSKGVCGSACVTFVPFWMYDKSGGGLPWSFQYVSTTLARELVASTAFSRVDYRSMAHDHDYLVRPIILRAQQTASWWNIGGGSVFTAFVFGSLGIPNEHHSAELDVAYVVYSGRDWFEANPLFIVREQSEVSSTGNDPWYRAKLYRGELLMNLNRKAVRKVVQNLQARSAELDKERPERLAEYYHVTDPVLDDLLTAIRWSVPPRQLELQKEYVSRVRQLELRRRLDAAAASQESAELLATHEGWYISDLQSVADQHAQEAAQTLATIQSTAQIGIRSAELTGRITAGQAEALGLGVDYAGRVGVGILQATKTGQVSTSQLFALLSPSDELFTRVYRRIIRHNNLPDILADTDTRAAFEAEMKRLAERYTKALAIGQKDPVAAFDQVYFGEAPSLDIKSIISTADEAIAARVKGDASREWHADKKTGCHARMPGENIAQIEWTGGCAGGLASGAGTLRVVEKDSSASTHVGTMLGGELNGKVGYTARDGKGGVISSCTLDYKHSTADGFGECTFADGARYVGNWRRGYAHGQGTRTFKGGDSFRGVFWGGWPYGEGSSITSGEQASGVFRAGHYDWTAGGNIFHRDFIAHPIAGVDK